MFTVREQLSQYFVLSSKLLYLYVNKDSCLRSTDCIRCRSLLSFVCLFNNRLVIDCVKPSRKKKQTTKKTYILNGNQTKSSQRNSFILPYVSQLIEYRMPRYLKALLADLSQEHGGYFFFAII